MLVLSAAVTDAWHRKVYNALTLPAMLLGLVLHTVAQGWPGLLFAILGLVVGGLLFYPAFWVGGMGGGDIKLMAALGSLMGWRFAVDTAVDTALLGGVAAVGLLLYRGELLVTLRRMVRRWILFQKPSVGAKPEPQVALPYAVLIAGGTFAALLLPSLIFPK